jgi:hypothetical protein
MHHRLELSARRTPLVIADLVNLKSEAILLGQGHGFHRRIDRGPLWVT